MAGGVSYGYPNAAAEEDMGEQQTFAGLAWSGKKKQTRREQFLAEMNAVIPWAELQALIVPHYPTGAGGRRAMPLEAMLRIYFLQHWYDLSDPAVEDALYDSEAMRRFVGLELGEETIPDETTILHFRHLLERHRLTEQMFGLVRRLLEQRGLLLKSGTVVDATILHAPSSTKNATDTRNPEIKQGRKGKTWYLGMKVHTGTDQRGLVHSLTTTHGGEADITQLPYLLHGAERELFGDQAYWAEPDRQAADEVEADQPRALADPGAGQARLSGGEASVGLHATGAWRRTRPGCSPRSPWRICIWYGDGCGRQGRRVFASAACLTPLEPADRRPSSPTGARSSRKSALTTSISELP